MEEQFKKAIIILMNEAGYYWCEFCEDWLKDEHHRKFIHNVGE